jgi:hypothetical protein
MPILVDFSCSIWKGASATLGGYPFSLRASPTTNRNQEEQHIQPNKQYRKTCKIDSLIQEKGENILEKTVENRRWIMSTSTAFQKKRISNVSV